MDSILYAWTQYIWPLAMFLIGLSFVVFIHELGHFLAARWAGIRVERFAIGMGPRLIGWQPGETDYCVCAFPLGGYVKMLGQEDFEKREEGDDADEAPGCSSRRLKSIELRSMRGGVPVFSRPTRNGRARRRSARRLEGGSPARPPAWLESPM